MITLHHAECLTHLRQMADNSIDSLVTDPPAGISFCGSAWDSDKGGRDSWIKWLTEVMTECLRVLKPGAHGLVWAIPRTSHWTATALEDAGAEIRDCIYHLVGTGFPKSLNLGNGIGTGLKPAVECWWLVRKPISEKTIAENLMKWGTGGIHIDSTRITNDSALKGRFPSNLVLDEVAAELLDEQSGILKQGVAGKKSRPFGDGNIYGTCKEFKPNGTETYACDKPSGASRFFYVAKASKSERGEGNNHPTVKSLKLMRYLCRLITPPNGLVLDPFMGSGSTGVAAKQEGFRFVGIEQFEEYFAIAQRRMND